MTPYQRLLLPENLYYAWRKAKRLYHTSDGYINLGELQEFELDLENRLQKIEEQFKKGSYKLQPIRPIPRPKEFKDGKYIDRQYYHIAIDDQIAWIAVVNALDPELDSEMHSWNYGNRLYRPAWYEEEDCESKLELGPYRHASGHLYKKFQQSWPLFRKHISLTSRTMACPLTKAEESESDQRAIEAANREKLFYLENDFWQRPQENSTDLYYASLDLRQFYPSIAAKKILKGLFLAKNAADPDGKLISLLQSMLKFTLDKGDVPISVLENVEPAFGKKYVKGLPTGLFAAGFLANAAMLPVDKIVDEKLRTEKSIAHFRFVDDHTILAYDFDQLCEWIEWYKNLVAEQIEIEVNKNKYDPKSLTAWLKPSVRKKRESSKIKAKADSKIDGTNPVKLLTKTIEKVSLIAGQNVNVLDDHDLVDRLKDLEWLLLADIPEREIRPDTRVAFAAGQIAVLAPLLIQEADGIVDTHRELAEIDSELRALKKYPESNREEIQVLEEKGKHWEEVLKEQETKLAHDKKNHLARCFGLLMHAMKEHPGKPRLFFRLHQYCFLTGYQGIKEIIKWIESLQSQEATVWADYYSSLMLQILAQNILKAIRVLTTQSSLRSDQNAAGKHLEDIITSINENFFRKSDKNEAWFHKVARREYIVSISIATEYLRQHSLHALSSKFALRAKFHDSPKLDDTSSIWFEKTGYSSGNWAYLAENHLRTDSNPTCLWGIFKYGFDYREISDQRAIRLYPEELPKEAWEYFMASDTIIKENDAGWIYDVLRNKIEWIEDAEKIHKRAFKRAIKVLKTVIETHISIADWIKHINGSNYSPFDPRLSEWTALEIVRRIIIIKLRSKIGTNVPLEYTHPQNILIPKEWLETNVSGSCLSWEEWCSHIKENSKIKFSKSSNFLLDYRYHSRKDRDNKVWSKQEDQFSAFGILLLNLLSRNHNRPITWNIRGNERISDIPRAQVFRSLAISSPTLLLIEGCIAPRSTENRLIAYSPHLFGLQDNEIPTDTRYDPPSLNNINDLIKAICNAQEILVENQLTVSTHKPRQLIPFRISNFAVSIDDESKENIDAE